MNVDFLVQILLGEHGDPKDPAINALYADLAGLPPLYIQASSTEMILDDSHRLPALAARPCLTGRRDADAIVVR
jgi:acetyl esterase/lipase